MTNLIHELISKHTYTISKKSIVCSKNKSSNLEDVTVLYVDNKDIESCCWTKNQGNPVYGEAKSP